MSSQPYNSGKAKKGNAALGKVLVIARPDGTCYATQRGLQLAAKVGREVEVVSFVHAELGALKVSSTQEESIRERMLADREEELAAVLEKYREPDQPITSEVVWAKDVDDWIEARCKRGGYDGVVKTASNRHSLVQGYADWHLLDRCPVPVLLVAEKRWHRTKPVLATLDLTSKSRKKKALNRVVLRMATAISRALEVELEIIAAIEIPTLLSDLDLVDPISYVKQSREAMQPQVRKLAAEFDLPESAFRSKRGPAEKVITSEAAKVRAQIVVMGTGTAKGIRGRLLGNRAERILRHLKTDVLAVKP